MENAITLSKRTTYKKKFSLSEMYRAVTFLPKAMYRFIQNRKSNTVDEHFVERLQLAVTEVNGCDACSYAHAKMALKMGMDNREIQDILSGQGEFSEAEAKWILFAQHYADTRAYPDREAFESVVKEYGKEKAQIILAAIQVIYVGNVYGIPLSAFMSRLSGRAYEGSSVFYELSAMLFGGLLLLPALLHGLARALFPGADLSFGKA